MSAKKLTRDGLEWAQAVVDSDERLSVEEARRLIAHVRVQDEALREIEGIVWKGHEGDPLKMIGSIARAAQMEDK